VFTARYELNLYLQLDLILVFKGLGVYTMAVRRYKLGHMQSEEL
jgi:hypothetical protein